MSKKIIGVTVGTQLPKSNLQQMDPTKGDYVLNKPIGLEGQVVGFDADGNMVAQDNILIDAELTQSNKAADAKATGDRLADLDTQFSNLSGLVGDTSVSEQINEAISNNVKQSDWNQTNEGEIDYIKNKPDVATDDDVINLMLELDMMPVVQDADGTILVDSDGAILLA